MDYELYMKVALKEAKKAFNKGEIPIGCIIVCNNKIISKAHNLKEYKKNAIKHAEIIAIQKASKRVNDWRLNNCIMYCTMEPCLMCLGAILESRIQTIVWGTNNNRYHDINSIILLNNTLNIKKNICKEECSSLIEEFFHMLRK